MNYHEKAIRPDIRFEGFTDVWEQRKLIDTFDFLSNNTLSRTELSTETGPAMNVHYGDVLIKFGEYLDATKVTLPFTVKVLGVCFSVMVKPFS